MRVRPLTDEEAADVRDRVPVPLDVMVEPLDDGVAFTMDKDLDRISEAIRSFLGASETVTWRLDGMGAFVWEQIDGEATVGEIADALAEAFGDEAEPALSRTWAFVTRLQAKSIVALD